MIDLTPYMPVAIFILGLITGYILSRKQDDRPILPVSTKDTPEELDPWTRAMLSDDELEDLESKRIHTRES